MRSTRRFGFLRDPVFLTAAAAYSFAWLFTHASSARAVPWISDHLADLFLVPCALPVLLLIQRSLGIRDEAPPSSSEIALYTALWAFLFEFAFPRWWPRGVADPGDVLAYALGAIAASIGWRWLYSDRQPLTAQSAAR